MRRANAAVVESPGPEDESWAAVVDMDDLPDEGKSCNTLSALTDTAALTSDIKVEPRKTLGSY